MLQAAGSRQLGHGARAKNNTHHGATLCPAPSTPPHLGAALGTTRIGAVPRHLGTCPAPHTPDTGRAPGATAPDTSTHNRAHTHHTGALRLDTHTHPRHHRDTTHHWHNTPPPKPQPPRHTTPNQNMDNLITTRHATTTTISGINQQQVRKQQQQLKPHPHH